MNIIELKQISPNDSLFGPSFGGKKGPTVFYQIYFEGKNVGEIEFATKQNEILSIYIDTSIRGKGIGKLSIDKLFDLHDTNQIVAWAAKSSIPFWKKVSTKRLDNDCFIIVKN